MNTDTRACQCLHHPQARETEQLSFLTFGIQVSAKQENCPANSFIYRMPGDCWMDFVDVVELVLEYLIFVGRYSDLPSSFSFSQIDVLT